MLQQQTIRTSLKRQREVDDHIDTMDRSKIVNRSLIAYDFKCSAYYKGQILDFQLSQVFQKFKYSVLFFCSYDFTQQSREDLSHIQKWYPSFMEFEALPIALTQDRAQIHKAYATPGGTSESLPFEPLYIMASDCTDRLISRFYKSNNTARSVNIIDQHLRIVFSLPVPDHCSFPMELLFNFFK